MGVEQPRSENFKDSNIWLAAGADGDVDLVKEYLMFSEPKVNANEMDENGYSPMHAAAAYNRLEILEILVKEFNGNVNIQDLDGDRPLHVTETEEMARLLITLGADPKLKNKKGYLPIQIADREEFDQVVEVLKEYTPEYTKLSESDDEDYDGEVDMDLEALESNAVHVRELLSQMGVNINFVNAGNDDDDENEEEEGEDENETDHLN